MKSSSTQNEIVTCPSCQTPNDEFQSFCRKCGAPIGATATIDPLNTIQAEGFMLRKAVDRRPSLIVLVGIWIMFFPLFIVGVCTAVFLIIQRRGLADFFFFWVMVGLTWIATIVLYRVTRNYFTMRETNDRVASN